MGPLPACRYDAQKQGAKQADAAQAQAWEIANRQAKATDEAANRANTKSANPMAAFDATRQAGKSGASGTMLTGPQGVDPSALTLGKNTLLGG